jgi:hypothetical protein
MKDLLKEAIADAKAVRETALANAKLALEEAFTPRLQSMLSAKLAEEMSEEDDDMPADEEMPMEGEDMDMEDHSEENVAEGDEEMPADDEPAEPAMTEEDDMDAEEDDLDLEEIIRELEGDEMSDDEEVTEGDDMSDEDEMTEGDEMSDDEEMTEGDDEEDINIEEIIRSLREEDEAADEAPAADDSEELEEAYNVIRFLKSKINEVNLLNAKLLYSNKLFRNFALNENQKMKVIENFDRAHNLREVKLVFSTLAESFKAPKKALKESFASKPMASTKPQKQVIAEGADLAARFKKLAGLK